MPRSPQKADPPRADGRRHRDQPDRDGSNATLIANGGTSGGSGGLSEFNGTASGGTARAVVNAGATLDLRPSLSASVAIGSIEGAGSLLLDGILAAGGNGRSTTFSGIISEGGGLTKEGSGTLTLTGANSYTGATRVAGGTLAGSGCASSALTVEGGGTIAPGPSIGTFACTAAVFQSGSTFRVEVGSSGPAADRLDAQGNVTIEAGATLDVSDLASSPVALAGGTLLPIIDYAGHTLTGTFNGLPGGAEFTVGANTFAIGYQAGGSTMVALTAVGGGGNAYALWAGANGIPGDSFDADFDKDGIPNGLEWVLGGNQGGQDPPLVAIAR
ncbi:MAG: autotransporter-associated beta strand repeat-containing protein [Verrucomicrobiales bacterium]